MDRWNFLYLQAAHQKGEDLELFLKLPLQQQMLPANFDLYEDMNII